MSGQPRAESSSVRSWRVATWVVLGVPLLLGLIAVGDHGATTDETLRMRAADGWAEAIVRNDVEDWATGVRAHYGVLFDQLGRWVWLAHHRWFGGTDEFASRHLLCFVTGWLGIVGTWALGRRLGGPVLGVTAAALLVLVPRFWGSSFANPKDIPFATTWVWAAWACVRAMQAPSRRSTVWVAVTAGLCSAIRPIGVVFFFVGAASIVAPVVPGGVAGRRVIWIRALREVLLAWVIGYAVVLSTWPVSWVHPPWHLLESAVALTRHPTGSRSLFLGQLYPHDDAPAAYAAVWIAITVPVTTLVLATAGMVTRVRMLIRQRPGVGTWGPWALLAGWIVGPMVVPALRRTTLYDTVRQLLFVMPAIALVAADGLVRTWNRWSDRRGRIALSLIVGLSYADVVWRSVRLHPYTSLFFNRAVGGLAGAQGHFDVAHYSETYREGLTWLMEHADDPVHVHSLGNGNTTASYYCYKLGCELNTPTFEWFMSEVRQGWQDILPGRVVHTIEREGVPLLVIKRVDPIEPMLVAARTRATAPVDRPPPSPLDVPGAWTPVPVQRGEVDLRSFMEPDEPVVLAVPVRVTRSGQARLYLRYYHGLRVWLDGREIYNRDAVAYQYRATRTFPSLVPVDVELSAGDHWLYVDLSRVYVPWGFGMYIPRGDGAVRLLGVGPQGELGKVDAIPKKPSP